MTEPRIIQSDKQPQAIEPLGNGAYYYNYNIVETTVEVQEPESDTVRTEPRWRFLQVYIKGTPDYRVAIFEVLRQYMSATEEIALLNKYNSFQLGIIDDMSVVDEYEEYCKLVAEVKAQVKKDFRVPAEDTTPEELHVSNKAIISLLKTVIKTVDLPNSQALECKALYPTWNSYVGKSLTAGDKVVYKEALYRVRQNIATVLENHAPGIATAALYEEINETQSGTKEDPIPYNNNMALTKGLYYIQDNVVYKCTRDTGQAVYNPLKDLVGLYVEVVK